MIMKPQTAGARVLVVDDDAFQRTTVSKRVQQLRATCLEAEDGLQAFAILRAEPVDLAIIDLEMPVMNGHELLSCIRGNPKTKHLPVLVLTAADDRASLERALQCGATSLMIKPLNWAAFSAHIEHILFLSANSRPFRTIIRARHEPHDAPELYSAHCAPKKEGVKLLRIFIWF
jgi:CheY-like chemotaxis protein